MNHVLVINIKLLVITKNRAAAGDMVPAGISRVAVRGFMASKRLSINRLKAIAAVRAKTMQDNTNKNLRMVNEPTGEVTANVKPMSAKGKAKTV